MISRKLNPDRIRRHMARSTPDEIRRYFDLIAPEWLDQQKVYNEWINAFAKRMKIKHPNQTHIDIYLDRDVARCFDEILVIARHVPEKKCGR